MPRVQGHPKTGGRRKGTPNKIGADYREAARAYTLEALKTLARVMREGQSEQARVAAANAILDRAWGKPSVMLAGDPSAPFELQLKAVADTLRNRLEAIESGNE